jgi:surfactin synthase thioesterase subunit
MRTNRPTVVALPYAGGSKHAYRKLESVAKPLSNWQTLELPGRGYRQDETSLQTISGMVDDLLRQARRYIETGPYLLYGHSMGALLAFELTRRFRAESLPLPMGLFVTGRSAPDVTIARHRRMAHYSSEQFWHELAMLGGVPAEVLQCREMQAYYEPTIRADIRALEDYHYRSEDPLPLPIIVRAGDQEGIAPDELHQWQHQTCYDLDCGYLTGHHFFIFLFPHEILRLLSTFSTNHAFA